MSDVTLDQLRTLREVAAEGSFSAAARKLGHVQAAVSQSIARLESELDLALFDRSGRTPRLTPAGEAVVAAAAKVHGQMAELDTLVARLRRGEEARLSIVVDAMFPSEALVGFAREFVAAHPAVELALVTASAGEVTPRVREGAATLGIAGSDADLAGLDQQHITDVSLVAVASKAMPATAPEIRLHAGGPGWQVVDLTTQRALVVAGLGWAVLPEHVVTDDLSSKRLRLLPLDVWTAPAPRALVLCRRRKQTLGPVASWAAANLTRLCRLASHAT